MASSPSISLVFVNYRSVFSLSLALESLFSFEQERDAFEVIIVNNDKEEEQAILALGQKLGLRVYTLPANSGFGSAANFGAAQAKGKFVAFINPDTVWQRPMLGDIDRFFHDSREEQILGVRLFDRYGRPEAFSRGTAPRFLTLLFQNIFPFYTQTRAHPPYDWVSGAALFLPKALFQRINGFDEDFFLYFEDVDLCLRAREQGAKIVSIDQFFLLHQGGKSFSSSKEQKKHFYISQQRYYAKHRSSLEGYLLRVLRVVCFKTSL